MVQLDENHQTTVSFQVESAFHLPVPRSSISFECNKVETDILTKLSFLWFWKVQVKHAFQDFSADTVLKTMKSKEQRNLNTKLYLWHNDQHADTTMLHLHGHFI